MLFHLRYLIFESGLYANITQVDKTLLRTVRDTIRQGFSWATREGPLCEERMSPDFSISVLASLAPAPPRSRSAGPFTGEELPPFHPIGYIYGGPIHFHLLTYPCQPFATVASRSWMSHWPTKRYSGVAARSSPHLVEPATPPSSWRPHASWSPFTPVP